MRIDSHLKPLPRVYYTHQKRVSIKWFESETVNFSVLSDSVASWTIAHQVPLSIEFSRQEYWCGLPFPSPGDLPHPGTEPGFPVLQADSFYCLSDLTRLEKRERRERRFRETDPPLISKVVQEINAHYSNWRWRQRYAPTAILNIIAFYPAGSFQVICFGECLDPQMKNLRASDMSVRKAKGWNELSPAENVQHNKRAISVTLRARRTPPRHRSPARRGCCNAHGDSRRNYPTSVLRPCSVKRGELLSIKSTGDTGQRELRAQTSAAIVRLPAPSPSESELPGPDELNSMPLTAWDGRWQKHRLQTLKNIGEEET